MGRLYVITTERGSRFWGDDPLAVKRGNRILKLHLSDWKRGDEVRWESKRAVVKKREIFLATLSENDPRIRPQMEYYYDRGNYYDYLERAFNVLKRGGRGPGIIRKIASALHHDEVTIRNWLSPDPPWFPEKPSDVTKLAGILMRMAREVSAARAYPYIKVLKRMGGDRDLKMAVGDIRGWRAGTGKRFSPRGKGPIGKVSLPRESGGKRRRRERFVNLEQIRKKLIEEFGRVLAAMPLDTYTFWARVKEKPHRAKSGPAKAGGSASLPSFRDGPVVGTDELLSRLGRKRHTRKPGARIQARKRQREGQRRQASRTRQMAIQPRAEIPIVPEEVQPPPPSSASPPEAVPSPPPISSSQPAATSDLSPKTEGQSQAESVTQPGAAEAAKIQPQPLSGAPPLSSGEPPLGSIEPELQEPYYYARSASMALEIKWFQLFIHMFGACVWKLVNSKDPSISYSIKVTELKLMAEQLADIPAVAIRSSQGLYFDFAPKLKANLDTLRVRAHGSGDFPQPT